LDIPNPEPDRLAAFGFSVAATDDHLFVGMPTFAETVFVFESIPEPSTRTFLFVLMVFLLVGGVAKFRKSIAGHR
jgi:hypothetical protein